LDVLLLNREKLKIRAVKKITLKNVMKNMEIEPSNQLVGKSINIHETCMRLFTTWKHFWR